MNVLRHRPSVKFDRIAPAGFRILAALDEATQRCGVDLTLTSGTDSHKEPSAHCTGEAYDVSVIGLSVAHAVALHSYLTARLGPAFTVLYEVQRLPEDTRLKAIAYVNAKATGAHFHIQRKKATVFPPVPTPPGRAA